VISVALEGLARDEVPKPASRIGYYYYHLDCYMSVLPDGRLLLKDNAMLSEATRGRLTEVFGEAHIIDLAWEEDCVFNLLPLTTPKGEGVILGPDLPEAVFLKLPEDLQAQWVSPSTYDRTSSARYDSARMEALKLKASYGDDGTLLSDLQNLLSPGQACGGVHCKTLSFT
jgi:hypothetical protein